MKKRAINPAKFLSKTSITTIFTLLVFVMFAHLTDVATAFSSPPSGSVAYYHFNKQASYGENDTFVYDFSLKGNNAKVYGAKWNSSGGLLKDGAFEFDGYNDKVLIPDKDSLSPATTNKYSVSFWVRFDKTAFVGEGIDKDYINFIGKGNYDDGHEFVFRQFNSSSKSGKNRISFSIFNTTGGSGAYASVQEPINKGEWVHFVGVYNGTSVQLWKNGVFKSSASAKKIGVVPKNTNAPIMLGTRDGQSFLKGSMDEFIIYNKALTSSEIQTIYKDGLPKNTTLPKITPNPNLQLNKGLKLYYKFNKNITVGENLTFIRDFSGNGHDGFAYGAKWNSTGGKFKDGAFEFDGTNDKITIPDNKDFSANTTGQITIAMWTRFGSTKFKGESGYLHFLGKGGYSPSDDEWAFRQYNSSNSEGRPNRISFYAFNLNGGLGTGSYFQDTINTNEWVHIVGVIKGKEVQIWKNGVRRDSDLLSEYNIIPKNGNAPVNVGTRDGDSWFKGSVDELRIYNRALNETEIKQLYALTKQTY